MPRAPKYYRNGDNLFVTSSVEEGLMFPPNALINMITLSCLARAQKNYPVRIFALSQSATHIHKGVQVIDPEDLASFMRYFKTETAHMLNRLLGRKKRTMWCEGYDSPIMCTPFKFQQKTSYIFSNPLKDDLEDTLDRYPGINTFDIFKKGKEHFIKVPLLYRTDIESLPQDKELTARDYRRLAKKLAKGKPTITLRIEPQCWKDSYSELTEEEVASYHQSVCQEVKAIEKESRAERQEEGRTVIGRERLESTAIGREYHPERTGKRTNFMTECPLHRAELMAGLRNLRQQAIDVYEQWKRGEIHVPYPTGLFPPPMPRLTNMLPAAAHGY